MARVFHASAFLLLSAAVSAHAGNGNIMGAGTSTCSQFTTLLRRYHRDIEAHYFAWAQGFMSGVNFREIVAKSNNQDLNSIPVRRQKQIIREYCQKHPQAHYMEAVAYLFTQFSPDTSESEHPN